jgi:hypothetical protein
MTQYTLTVLVRVPPLAEEQGRAFFQLLGDWLPEHFPDAIGSPTRPDNPLEPKALDKALKYWKVPGLTAVRREPRFHIYIRFWPPVTKIPQHSAISIIALESKASEDRHRVRGFFFQLCEMFESDFAAAHMLTRTETMDRIEAIRNQVGVRPEMAERGAERALRKIQSKGFASVLWEMTQPQINSHQLKSGIPDLYWLTTLGPPYVELFGRDRIESSPVHRIQRLNYGGVGLELVPTLEDEAGDWERFLGVRLKVKEHLNSNAFFDSRSSRKHIHNAPVFRYPESMFKTAGPD